MGNLSNNISRYELACNCGCGQDTVDFELVHVVQDVCDHFGCRVTFTSGNRCPYWNNHEGGGKNSQHLYGRAADCKFHGQDPDEVYAYLCKKYPDKFGFGLYNTFVHIDTRTGRARWNGLG